MNKEKWAYSLDQEYGWVTVETRDDAVAEGQVSALEAGQDHFFISPIKWAKPLLNSIDSLVEQLIEDTCDEAPDECEGWINDVREQAGRDMSLDSRVREVLLAWLKENKLEPNWFVTTNTLLIEVSDDDNG